MGDVCMAMCDGPSHMGGVDMTDSSVWGVCYQYEPYPAFVVRMTQ